MSIDVDWQGSAGGPANGVGFCGGACLQSLPRPRRAAGRGPRRQAPPAETFCYGALA